MEAVNITTARQNLFGLAQKAISTSEPIMITSRKGDVVMLSKEDYSSLMETVYLLSVPGVREAVLAGRAEALEEGATLEDIGWNIK